jgi:adenine-specific DNA-methyltransferase
MPFLDWVNKNQATQASQKVPYHLLRQVSAHGDVGGAHADNLLIQGDNLLALKALLPFYRGQVKCIFIDPPYNTQSAFEHYDDRLEHSQWLSMMYPRLVLLRELLRSDGFIVFHIDDAESHYAKVMLDEIFTRSNYQTTFYVQVRYTSKTLKSDMAYHKQIEQALVYRHSWGARPNRPVLETEGFEKFNYEIDTKSKGRLVNLGGKDVEIFQPGEYEIRKVPGHINGLKEIWATGSILDGNSSGRFFRDYLTGRFNLDGAGALYKVQGIGDDGLGYRYITGPKKVSATKGKYFQGVPMEKRSHDIQHTELSIENFYDFSPQFGNCRNEGGVDFRSGKKPEAYIKKVLELFSAPNDLVVDSFLGSGSSAAVAHKMGRRYIGIEMGDHAQTHCLPRLEKVIDGEQGGISQQIGWQGGGGFRFCKLGSAAFDANGSIHPDVKFNALAAFLWHFETGTPGKARYDKPRLGVHNGTAYFLLYNGILGDLRPEAGNVLTNAVLQMIEDNLPHPGPKVIYGEKTNLSSARLARLGITFKQTPYDIPQR